MDRITDWAAADQALPDALRPLAQPGSPQSPAGLVEASPSAASPSFGGGGLQASSFVVRYDWGGASVGAATTELASIDADVLIMEGQYAINAGADQAFTSAQIDQIKAGAGGKTVIGYMSIGAIQDQRDRYADFQGAVVASSGHEKWLAYWDPAHVEACNTALLGQYKAWIADMVGQHMDGAFLDVVDSYWRPDVQAAIGGADAGEDIRIATTALLTIISELDAYARSLDPDFKLVLGHNPDLVVNYRFPGGSGNPHPDEALISAVQDALDGALLESVDFSDPSDPETQRILTNLASASNGFGDATLMALGYFPNGGSFGDGDAATWQALHYEMNAALLGFTPYATANTAASEGFGRTFPIFDLADDGPNALLAAAGGARINGQAGGDLIQGQGGTDKLVGSGGDDEIHGGGGGDRLLGGGGADTLDGGSGADVLTGGRGRDELSGGEGADTFVFLDVSDSDRLKRADKITDLEAGDHVDLSAIDADRTIGGDQAFHMVKHFTHHPGELVMVYRAADGVTQLNGDTDGDGKADLVVVLDGDQSGFAGLVL